jgi:DNA-binding HxlR family transcriptional regulator
MSMEHRPFDVYAKQCPSRAAFEANFSRWGILILGYLSGRPGRFGEIHRGIDGISERMLAQSLKVLMQEGLVSRQITDGNELRAVYSLTPAGMTISSGVQNVLGDLYAVLETRNPTR